MLLYVLNLFWGVGGRGYVSARGHILYIYGSTSPTDSTVPTLHYNTAKKVLQPSHASLLLCDVFACMHMAARVVFVDCVWDVEQYGKLLSVGGGKERMTAHWNGEWLHVIEAGAFTEWS